MKFSNLIGRNAHVIDDELTNYHIGTLLFPPHFFGSKDSVPRQAFYGLPQNHRLPYRGRFPSNSSYCCIFIGCLPFDYRDRNTVRRLKMQRHTVREPKCVVPHVSCRDLPLLSTPVTRSGSSRNQYTGFALVHRSRGARYRPYRAIEEPDTESTKRRIVCTPCTRVKHRVR